MKHRGSCIFHIYYDTLSGPCIMQTLFKDELWGVGGNLSWGNEMENEIAPVNSPSLHSMNTMCLHAYTRRPDSESASSTKDIVGELI